MRDGTGGPLFSHFDRSVARPPAGSAKESLTAFLVRSGRNLDALQHSIETWFDDAMDRLSGAYKRFSQYFTLTFDLAVAGNVDSISLARTLWTNQDARSAMVGGSAAIRR